jgi:hypothetical protein
MYSRFCLESPSSIENSIFLQTIRLWTVAYQNELFEISEYFFYYIIVFFNT